MNEWQSIHGDPVECLFVGADGAPVRDAYGYPVRTLARQRLCHCTATVAVRVRGGNLRAKTARVPCQERFRCMSSHHRGSRWVPYCASVCDEEEDATGIAVCDDCWAIRDRNRARRGESS